MTEQEIEWQNRRERKMGKVAENEKHKMKANFYNNIAASVIITGLVVPYLAFLFKMNELAAALGWKNSGIKQSVATFLTLENLVRLGVLIATGILAWKIARTLREGVEKELDKITD
jgi:hypothetical protein